MHHFARVAVRRVQYRGASFDGAAVLGARNASFHFSPSIAPDARAKIALIRMAPRPASTAYSVPQPHLDDSLGM